MNWRLIIVDDDIHILEHMEKAIPWNELNVELVGVAMDGEEGLQLVEQSDVDIVITDVYMPVMNGIQMIENLRDCGFEGKVIILSGYSDFEYARQALRLNVDDYISKPVTVEELKKVIQNAIQQLEKEMNDKIEKLELLQKLKDYEPFVTKEWIKGVLTGTMSEAGMSIVPEPKEIWLDRLHLVIGIELVRKGRLALVPNNDWNLFRYAVGNIIEEVVRKEWPESNYYELHASHGALLLHIHPKLVEDQLTLMSMLEETSRALIKSVYEYLQVSIQVGIGGTKSSIQDIADSTEEAFQALLLKEKNLNNCHDIFIFDPIAKPESELNISKEAVLSEDRPVKILRLLSDALVTASQSEASRLAIEYIEQVKTLQPATPFFVQVLGAELWHTFSYALLNSGVEIEKLYPEMNLISELEMINKLPQLEEWFLRKINLFFASRTHNVSYKHKQAIEFMLEYIHKHLDEQLTLEELSGKLFISKNHLNQIFKKATGEPFMTYLTKVRMERAKTLIQEGKYRVYEIAEKVGYPNVPYFSTVFKKYFGFSPNDLNNKYQNTLLIDKN